MNVKIQETGEVKSLSIIDGKSGVNWVGDLIGNSGATTDGQFVWSEEDDAYLADEDTYDWWAKYIDDTEVTEAEVAALAEELGISADDINMEIANHAHSDYEMHRRDAIRTMQALREQYT